MKINGDWLAGFIDGEGSFNISCHGGNYQPRFSLKLRDDDSEILKNIHEFVGVGTLIASKCSAITSKYYSVNAKNQYRYDITGSHNIKLISILDTYPLKSKKLRDYKFWKEAVEIYSASLFNRWSDPLLKEERNKKLLMLKASMENVRKYHE